MSKLPHYNPQQCCENKAGMPTSFASGLQVLTYTAFNDSIQSFLKNIGCATPAAELDEKELTIKLLRECLCKSGLVDFA